jgi:putative acetyltransferase
LQLVRVRPYQEGDAGPTLAVYERAVHQTAASDYGPEQLAAWAPLGRDAAGRADWARRREAAQTVVAVEGGRIAGFSDLVDDTLLDMLFVDPSFARRGVGSLLIETVVALAKAADAPYLETHASVTARPVFERHGFVLLARQSPVIRGVKLTNFRMRRPL